MKDWQIKEVRRSLGAYKAKTGKYEVAFRSIYEVDNNDFASPLQILSVIERHILAEVQHRRDLAELALRSETQSEFLEKRNKLIEENIK